MNQQQHAKYAQQIEEFVDREGKKISSLILEIYKTQLDNVSLEDFLIFLDDVEILDYIITSIEKNLIKIFTSITDISLTFAESK